MWVHPYGTAANRAACLSVTDPGGTCVEGNCANYCPYDTANDTVTDGDVVYLKGGTYTVSGGNDEDQGLAPQASGSLSGNTCTSKITYQNAPGETPIITGSDTLYGIYLIGRSCIKITGITFRNIGTYGFFRSATHNEITNCIFEATTAAGSVGFGLWFQNTCAPNHDCWNTHNWIHGNVISKRVKAAGAERCDEGMDLIRIGDDTSDAAPTLAQGNNNNTIEDNLLYHTNHTAIDTYGNYTVIRNNVIHNEPWYDGCTNWDDSYSSSSTLTIGTGNQTFTTNAGMGLNLGVTNVVAVLKSTDYSVGMKGVVSAYNNTTGEMTIAVSAGWTSGSCTDCTSWKVVVNGHVPFYETSAYNDLYGHRNIQLSDAFARAAMYTLVESNRLGHAGMNPNNGGAENLTVAGPGNLIRYNFLYNSMASGISYKYADGDCVPGTKDHPGACGAINNHIYNNTIYKSGTGVNWRVLGADNMSYAGQGIGQSRATGTGDLNNVLKNNLVYDNKEGAICGQTLYNGDYTTTQCSAEAYDTVSNNYTGGSGDSPTNNPLFVNPDLTAPMSQHLFSGQTGYAATPLPNLSLQASSPAIDIGVASQYGSLTTVAAADTSSGTSLVLTDALYFQAGSAAATSPMGSALSNVQGDWILVGATVGAASATQITDINYTTNTATISPAITRADGDYVWLYKKSDGVQVLYGSAPDYGAYEYEETGNVRGATISGATIQ
jgi:hypothetical protein